MKNQIWSPDTVFRAGGFQPFQVEGASASFALENVASESSKGWGFEILPETVEKLLNEPGVRARMDLLVQERVNQAINNLLESLSWIKEITGNTKVQGRTSSDFEIELNEINGRIENHWKLKFQELEDQKTKASTVLELAISEWKQKRDSLLKVHEKEWIQTLGYLLERFLMKQKIANLEDLNQWLCAAVEEFSAKAPVKVFVSSFDYQELKLESANQNSSQWSFQEDKSLVPGQIRLEANNAGVVFDREKNLRKVLELLEVES